MVEVGVETEPRLSDLLDRVEQGETITIIRGGRAVARPVPAADHGPEDRRRVIAQLKQLRTGQTLGGLSLRELIEGGRR